MSDGKVRVSDLVGVAPGFKTERQETEQRIADLEAQVKRMRAALMVFTNPEYVHDGLWDRAWEHLEGDDLEPEGDDGE